MKPLLFILVVAALAFTACKKKTCPAYNENQQETYTIKKNAKHKKAKLY